MNRVLQRRADGRETFKNRFSPGYLRRRLILAIVLVTLAVSITGLIINWSVNVDQARQALVETNLARLKALKIDFVEVITGDSPDAAVELVDHLSSFPEIRNVVLQDNDGRVVFRFNRDRSDHLELPRFVDLKSSAIVYDDHGLLIHHTVTYEGKQFGWVNLHVSTKILQGLARKYAVTALLLVIGTAIIAVALAWIVGHYITRPIRDLAAFTRRVSRTREFDRQTYTREGGEVGVLYDGVNEMLKEISVAEREINRVSESRLRSIIESSLDGVISINAEGRITYWGRQNVTIFGWLEEEVLGSPITESIIPERFRKQHSDGLQQFMKTGESSLLEKRFEISGLHRDGHEFPIEISLSANKQKESWVFNAFIRDLTELREAEQELREAGIQLQRKERLAAVGQLTATVAHELRNPMGTIRNSLYTLKGKLGKQDSAITGLVERVDRSVDRCDLIISELLDFTRDRKIFLTPIPIDDWLGKLLDRYDCPERVEIVRTLSSDVIIPLDAAYFESAVTNVLDNAVQAVLEKFPDGGGRVEVEVIPEDDRLGVVVSDNGPGIPAEEQLKVFEPLYSTKTYGVGLGLPTVKIILEKHKGEVQLETSDSGGIRVSLWLKAGQ